MGQDKQIGILLRFWKQLSIHMTWGRLHETCYGRNAVHLNRTLSVKETFSKFQRKCSYLYISVDLLLQFLSLACWAALRLLLHLLDEVICSSHTGIVIVFLVFLLAWLIVWCVSGRDVKVFITLFYIESAICSWHCNEYRRGQFFFTSFK